MQWQAPTITATTYKPTIILSPGGDADAIMFTALSTEFASQGYIVLSNDRLGEAPFLQLPFNGGGVYGIDITAS